MAKNKLYLITVEVDFMEYKSGRVVATSKRKAMEQYCTDLSYLLPK